MNWLKRLWQRYCQWLDETGLNGGQCRCIPLDEKAQQALERDRADR
ncbi:DUF5363 family protein [Ferrimonas senticii]|nr:DUF5363 family protein [Ferrimonas senticii]